MLRLRMWSPPDVARDFRDRHDAGHRLAVHPHLTHALEQGGDWVVAAVMPGGAPVAAVIASHWALPMTPMHRDLSDGEHHLPAFTVEAGHVSGRDILLVDDGVETGTASRACAAVLRSAGAGRIVLTVPVCSHQAQADLVGHVDEVIALVRPLARRALIWHYDVLDPVDPAVAEALVTGEDAPDR